MTYDNWKTTDPNDQWLGPEPEPEPDEKPEVDLADYLDRPCPYCDGTGMARGYLCAPCDGWGYAS